MDSYASRFWVAILVLLGSLLTSTHLAIESLRHSVQQSVYDAISNRTTSTHQALTLWRLKEEKLLQERVQALLSVVELLQTSSIKQRLIEELMVAQMLHPQQHLTLLSMDNRIVWQSRESNLVHPSMASTMNPFLRKVSKKGYATSHPMLVERDDQTPAQVVLMGSHLYVNQAQQWILVYLKRVRETLMPILNRNRLGRTGETYVFNKAGAWLAGTTRKDALVRAGLLYPDQQHALGLTLLNPGIDLITHKHLNPTQMQLPFIEPIQQVMSNKKAGVAEYRDYLGKEVMGAWLWDESWQLGIVSQQNRTEAFSHFIWMQRFVWTVMALVVVIIVGLTQIYLRGRTRFANANAQLSAILHNTDLPMYLRDERDAIIDCNASYHQLNLNQNLDEDSYRKLKKMERQVLVTQLAMNETLWVYLNHQRRVLRVNMFPVVLANELPVKYYLGGVMADITEQALMIGQLNTYKNNLEKRVEQRTQKIQKQKIQMKALLENAPDGIATLDSHGRVLYANPRFSELFNQNIKDCTDAFFYDLTLQQPQSAIAWLNSIEAQTIKEMEVAQGDTVRFLELSFNPYYVLGVLYYSLVVRDASKEKALRQALVHLRNQSETTTRTRTLSLNSLTKDLKMPVHSLMQSLETLVKKMSASSTLAKVVWSARMIARSLEDAQAGLAQQAGSIRLAKQPTPMYELFVSMRSMLMTELQEHSVQLLMTYQEQMPSTMILDAVQVQKLFLKLCLASFVALERGHIEVEMLCTGEDHSRCLRLNVRIKGYGMTLEQLKSVFSPDASLDPALARRFEEQGFSGIGFNHALVALQGTLAIKSMDDGYWLDVQLPVAVDTKILECPSLSLEDYRYRHCWLMIEDETLNGFVHNELSKRGIQVLDAYSALAAGLNAEQQQLLATQEPLLILDSVAWGCADTLKSLSEWQLEQLPALMIGPAYFIEHYQQRSGVSDKTATLVTPMISTELVMAVLKQDKQQQLAAYLNLAAAETDNKTTEPVLQSSSVVGG